MLHALSVLVLLLCWTSQVWATTRYASPGASGGLPCPRNAPCSVRTCIEATFAGDQCFLRAGTYDVSIRTSDMAIRSGTSDSNRVVIAGDPADPPQSAIIRPTSGGVVIGVEWNQATSYVTFENMVLDAGGISGDGINSQGPDVHHIRWKDLEVKNAMGMGPSCGLGGPESCPGKNGVDGHSEGNGGHHQEFLNLKVHHNGFNRLSHNMYMVCNDCIVDGGEYYDSEGYGLQIYNSACGGTGCNHRFIVRNVKVHDNRGDGGLTVNYGNDIKVYNNLIYNNNSGGIRAICYGNTNNTQIYNNTFYGNNGAGLEICGGITNTQVKNNIFMNNGAIGGENAESGGTTPANNLCFNTGGTTTGCTHSGDPRFMNAGLADFRLQSTSAAKNQGANLASAGVTDDFVHFPRPSGGAYDIGAYEFDEGGGPPPPTGPTVRYMSPSGDDSRSCETSKNPATPKQNFSSAIPCMQAGDTLQLRGGTYSQRLQPSSYSLHPDGTDYGSGAVTLMSYPGETAIITQVVDFSWDSNLHYWIFKDLTFDGTASAQANGTSEAFWFGQGVHHIRLDNITVQRQLGGWTGIAINGQASDRIEIINSRISGFEYAFYMRGTNWLVNNNEIYNNEGYGVHVYDSGSTIVSGNIISNNYIHDNGQSLAHGTLSAGITIGHGTDNRAINNIVTGQGIQGNCLAGIQIGNQSTNHKIYNNTIVDNGACPGISINAGDPVGTDIQNNLIFNNTGGQIQNNAVSFTSGKNLCGASGPGCELVTSDPKLTNTGSGAARYKLQTTEPRSPAIDAGNTLAAVPTDIAGVSRPQPSDGSYDIGAYEAPAGGGRVSPGTFWVSSSGVDPPTRTCGAALNNINAPLLTFNAGRACLTVAGDKLFLRGGSYDATMYTGTQPIASGTSWAEATTIAAYNTEPVTLILPTTSDIVMYFNASDRFIILDRLTFDCHNQANSNGLAMATGTHHIRFQNGEIKNCHFEPVYIEGSDNNEILNSAIHGSALKDCIGLNVGSDNTILRGNTIHTCPSAGILAGSPNTGTVIRDNVIHDAGTDTPSAKAGIMTAGATSPVIINNLVYNNYRGIHLQAGTTNDAKVFNNTVHGNATQGVQIDATAGAVVTNNIVAANTIAQIVNNGSGPTPTTNLTTAPPFDPAFPNKFHLTSAATTAIDVGTPLTADVPKDYEGIDRPQGAGYDIGASEFVGTIVPEEPPPGIAIRMPYWRGQGFFWR